MTVTSDEIKPYLQLKGKPINSRIPPEKVREAIAHLPPRVVRAMLATAFPRMKFEYRDGRFEVQNIETDIPPLPVHQDKPIKTVYVKLSPAFCPR